jgi:ATP-dependent DNA helicase RecG
MSSFIQIRIYDDKFWVWNSGKLPEDISLESLRGVHSSHPRNPLIADVCFKGGYIDSWGRGTLKIINACREAELPEPSITEQFGGMLVEIFKNRLMPEQLKKLGLNERQLMAVAYVKENGSITNSKYQTICRVSKSTATRDIKELEDKKVLVNQGTKGSSAVYGLA